MVGFVGGYVGDTTLDAGLSRLERGDWCRTRRHARGAYGVGLVSHRNGRDHHL